MIIIKCDFCKKDAEYDGKTVHGPWAYMCGKCFEKHGYGLGTGLGQRLENEDNPDFKDSIEIRKYSKKKRSVEPVDTYPDFQDSFEYTITYVGKRF